MNNSKLAQAAFDVLMRRRWSVDKHDYGWFVSTDKGQRPDAVSPDGRAYFDDPFTALVETEKWYKEIEECGT